MMSMREAILQCFRDEPGRVFRIEDLCVAVEKYYEISTFRKELDPLHPQQRYRHAIRSIVARLKQTDEIARLSRDQYQLSK